MKCPNCGKEGFKYTDRKEDGERKRAIPKVGKDVKEDTTVRQSNIAKCKKCGYEGKI